MRRFSRSTASFARFTLVEYVDRPIPASTMTSVTTINNSISVKPRWLLPVVTVTGPIERFALRLRIHIENVLPSPRFRIRCIARRAQAPVGRSGHRVVRDAAQEPKFSSGCVVRRRDTFDECLERGRIALRVVVDVVRRNEILIRSVLVLVDGSADFSKTPAQFNLAVALHRD